MPVRLMTAGAAVTSGVGARAQDLAANADAATLIDATPATAILLALAAGGLLAGLGGVALHAAGRRRLGGREQDLRSEAEDLRSALDETRALLTAEPHLLLLWRGTADAPPVLSGKLPADLGVPDDPEDCLDFARWLDEADARQLAAAISELRIGGTPFTIFVRTPAGARLAADGFAVAGKAALKLKPLRGDSFEYVEAREEADRLTLELGSLKAGLATAPQPAWLRDRAGRLIWVNAAFAAGIGAETPAAALASRKELAGGNVRDKSLQAIRAGTPSRQRVHTGQGASRRSYEIVEQPAPIGSVGIATDITEAEQLRDELDRVIGAHARTLDQLATGVAIFDPDQRLKFFNSAYARLWSLDEAWLRTEPKDGEILDRLRDQGRLEERADFRTWRTKQLKAYDSGETIEQQWHLPDGRSLRVVAEPHPLGGITYVYEDVTERVALETRYNRLLSVQKETLDHLHEGVALFGSNGRLMLFNPAFARIWQLEPATLSEEPHMDRVIAACQALTGPGDHWDELRQSVGAMGAGRQPTRGRMQRPDGVVVQYASVPLPDGATLFTYVDVTDSWRIESALRDRNEALLAADRLKTAFLSHVSYELRAPLTAIMGFAEFLDLETMGALNDKQREYLGHIRSASGELRDLINGALDLASIDAGAMELDLQPIDIQALAEDARDRAEAAATRAGLSISVDIEPDMKSFPGDEPRLRQVLDHLLSNAIGFSSEGGRITISARRSETAVEISVADEGRGIDPKVRDRIFERFETHTEGTDHRGTGLGLPIVKGLVELHQGSVAVESEPGRGTTITCSFPLNYEARRRGPVLEAGSGLHVSPALDQTAPPSAPRH